MKINEVDLKSRRFLSDAEFDKKPSPKIEKKVVDLSKDIGLNESIKILKEFEKELKSFMHTHSMGINDLKKEILDNVQECENIAEHCNHIKFAEDDGKLILYFLSNNERFIMSIDDIEDNSERGIYEILEKRDKEFKEELKILLNEKKNTEDDISNLKPRTPKKFLKIFTDSADKINCQKEYELNLKELNDELERITYNINDLKLQIESNNDTYTYYKKIDDFIDNLTDEQKQSIKLVYNELNNVVEETNSWYNELNTIMNKKPTLKDYLAKIGIDDPKKTLYPLLKYIYDVHIEISDKFDAYAFSEITKYIDFGKDEDIINILTQAIDNRDFGKINKRTLSDYSMEKQ